MANPARSPEEPEVDHVAEALDALPVAFRTAITMAIVRVFAERLAAVWQAQRDARRAMDLTDPYCEGHPWALQKWADLLGVPRRAKWDAHTWRIVLLAAVQAQRSNGTREDVLAVVRALTPAGAAEPEIHATPLTVWVHAPGITDPAVQEALRELLLAAIPDVADLVLDFAGEDVIKFDTPALGFDGPGKFS